MFEVSWGKNVGAVDPKSGDFRSRVDFTKDELFKLLTTHAFRPRKDGPYITRPMGGNGRREDKNADPWLLVPVDIDELQPDEMRPLVKWLQESKLECCMATTFSHSPERPKVRLWFTGSRPIQGVEHSFVHQALARLVPFKLDPCMLKPSQPAFLPSCPAERKAEAFSEIFEGEPLDIDRLLNEFRDEIEEQTRARAERAKGVVGKGVRQTGGLIEYFNAHYPLTDLLERHGYHRKGSRYVAPASKSGRPAVILTDNHSLLSYHEPEHDPLAVRNKRGEAIVIDTFAVYCKLDHLDDFKAAFTGALKWARSEGWSEGDASHGESIKLPAPVLFNAAELYSSLRPQEMLVEGMLEQGAMVLAVGDSNSGKTTILQHLAMQVAQGAPVGTRRTKKGKVLWIAGEDMENAKYRVVAMCEEYGIDPVSLADNYLLLPQPVAVLEESSMKVLQETVQAKVGNGGELALIILDSKSVNWGGEDENSNDENARFVMAVRKHLVEAFGNAAVIITHHLTKHREKEARSARGAGALLNNIDHEWLFQMNQEARLSAMGPGSKIRIERWAEQRYLIKAVDLPRAKLPQLVNNFGEMPRVSVAEPVNQYNKSLRGLQQDQELRAVLLAVTRLLKGRKQKTLTLSRIAGDVGWSDSSGHPDYRKAKRYLIEAQKQKLATVSIEGKETQITLTDAGTAFISADALSMNEDPATEEQTGDQDRVDC